MDTRAYMLSDHDTIPIIILKKYPEYSLVMDDFGRYYKVKNDKVLTSEICSKTT